MVVEITYRGIPVARGKLEGEGDPGFLPFEAPLPVGTRVLVYAEGEAPREAVVTQVVEQDSTAKSPPGMKLRWAAAAPVRERAATEPAAPAIEAVPEPADSSARTLMMPAVIAPDEGIEPADSPRVTLLNMPAIRDAEPAGDSSPGAEPEPDAGPEGGGRKRRRRR